MTQERRSDGVPMASKAEFGAQAARSLSDECCAAIRHCPQSSASPSGLLRPQSAHHRQAGHLQAPEKVLPVVVFFTAHLSKRKHMSGWCESTDE